MRPVLEGIWHGMVLGAALIVGLEVYRWWKRGPLRRAIRQLGPPEPPENLQLVFGDGRIVPVEAVYVGVEPAPDGGLMHHWRVVTQVAATPASQPIDLDAGRLPCRTLVSLAMHVHDPEAGG